MLQIIQCSFYSQSLINPVENIGFEPMTPCVQGRCSKPTELIPRKSPP